MRWFHVLVVVTIAVVLALPAAGDTTTSIKNKTAEITVNVEGALKKYPALFDNCAAEGKVWAAKAQEEANREVRELPQGVPTVAPWTYERTYKLRSAIGPYVSILREDYTNSGGAHPNRYTDTSLWDQTAGKRISIRPFFDETEDGGSTMTALAKLVRAALATEKRARGGQVKGNPEKDFWLQNVKPWLLKLGPVSLAPSTERDKSSGLTFHFSPYMVGAYAEGDDTIFVPWTDLRPYLSAQGAALFGGSRPASDRNPQP